VFWGSGLGDRQSQLDGRTEPGAHALRRRLRLVDHTDVLRPRPTSAVGVVMGERLLSSFG
jgi:hypothetical protein